MSTWFISRHPGAVEWIKRQGIEIERYCEHLPVADVAAGDTVIGTLPVHLAAAVFGRGARYRHLSVDLTSARRGTELNADELERYGARLEEVEIRIVPAQLQSERTL